MMYGTVARMRVKPGKEQTLMGAGSVEIPGQVFTHVFKLDSGNNEYILVTAFESKEAYVRNAESAEMNNRYLEYREALAADPEWSDGEIVFSDVV